MVFPASAICLARSRRLPEIGWSLCSSVSGLVSRCITTSSPSNRIESPKALRRLSRPAAGTPATEAAAPRLNGLRAGFCFGPVAPSLSASVRPMPRRPMPLPQSNGSHGVSNREIIVQIGSVFGAIMRPGAMG